jgi:hypothetical protein
MKFLLFVINVIVLRLGYPAFDSSLYGIFQMLLFPLVNRNFVGNNHSAYVPQQVTDT